ncbi:hypothetical protein NSS94_08270 [Paenibacillus sp. FSL L8-0644]
MIKDITPQMSNAKIPLTITNVIKIEVHTIFNQHHPMHHFMVIL